MSTEPTKAVATEPVYSLDQLANVKSFEDALALLAEAGVQVSDISEYGDGFAVIDKATLVGVAFIILDYKFAKGDFGNDFAIVRVVTTDGRKGIFTDGSEKSGIRPQIVDLQNRGVVGGVMVKNGLTRSDYTYVDDKGNSKPASTFYLSM